MVKAVSARNRAARASFSQQGRGGGDGPFEIIDRQHFQSVGGLEHHDFPFRGSGAGASAGSHRQGGKLRADLRDLCDLLFETLKPYFNTKGAKDTKKGKEGGDGVADDGTGDGLVVTWRDSNDSIFG
jgi:hypothetical protein